MRISDWSSDVCSSDLPHHVEQVPARVAAAPLAFVGIAEVAEQAVADELVVEAQRVVAQGAGFRARHFLEDAGEGLGFGDPVAQRVLRRDAGDERSEEHTSELQSLMRISYAVFCLKKKNTHNTRNAIS